MAGGRLAEQGGADAERATDTRDNPECRSGSSTRLPPQALAH
jgi:hypothetical protein